MAWPPQNYTVLLQNIRASNPDAVVHLGYPGNDIAFFRNVQESGIKSKWLFGIYPGLETQLVRALGRAQQEAGRILRVVPSNPVCKNLHSQSHASPAQKS